MNCLLDTNILIMFILDDEKLNPDAKKTIMSENNNIFINIASLWEICIKYSLGKLELGLSLAELFNIIENEAGFEILPVNRDSILVLERLPFHHRDPFDRQIYAQSVSEKMKFIYTDSIFDKYIENKDIT